MSGFNQFTALIVERNWDLLSTTIDRVGENERRQMASQPFNGDLSLHVALKLEAPTEILIKLLNAYPQAAVIKGKNNMTGMELAHDHCADSEVIQMMKKSMIKSKKSKRSTIISDIRSSFSNFIRRARVSLRKMNSETVHF